MAYNQQQFGGGEYQGTGGYVPAAPIGGGGGGMQHGAQQQWNVSPDMLNFGLSAGQDIINKQRDRFMPGMSTLWNSLKIYFAVNNDYVAKKLFTIVHPLGKKKDEWKRKCADESMGEVGVHNRIPGATHTHTHAHIYTHLYARLKHKLRKTLLTTSSPLPPHFITGRMT